MNKKEIRKFWNKNMKVLDIIFETLSKDDTFHEDERKRFKTIANNIGELSTKSRKFTIFDANGKLIEEGINIGNIAIRLVQELDKIGVGYNDIMKIFNNTQNIISGNKKSRFKEIDLSNGRKIWVSYNIGTTQPNFKGLEEAILNNNYLHIEEEWK